MPTYTIPNKNTSEPDKKEGETLTVEPTETSREAARPVCEECEHLGKDGGCAFYRSCEPWNQWFREEWRGIREAAKLLKKKEKTL